MVSDDGVFGACGVRWSGYCAYGRADKKPTITMTYVNWSDFAAPWIHIGKHRETPRGTVWGRERKNGSAIWNIAPGANLTSAEA